MAEGGRVRGSDRKRRQGTNVLEFVNPYPWMSQIEAMVHLALEEHNIPFSWRWFDGVSPTFNLFMAQQGWQPEFTLREYNTVVMVQGAFYGTLPGVLDKMALAEVCFEQDGWKVVILWDTDIRTEGAWELLTKAIPTLGSIRGPLRPNPYGHPDLLAGISHHHGTRPWHQKVAAAPTQKDVEDGKHRHYVRRFGGGGTDGGRVRRGVSGRREKPFNAR